jgi:hypothetical protein
MLYKF